MSSTRRRKPEITHRMQTVSGLLTCDLRKLGLNVKNSELRKIIKSLLLNVLLLLLLLLLNVFYFVFHTKTLRTDILNMYTDTVKTYT
jgi:hypothetical protein